MSSVEAITVKLAQVYARGNVTANNTYLKRRGMYLFSAPFVDTQDACTAANLVLANAGVHPLDLLDQHFLSMITVPSC